MHEDSAAEQAAYRKRNKSKQLAVHFQSLLDVRATPPDLFAVLHQEFGFVTDVCALPHNTKCERFFSPEVNGLAQEWTGVCFMNPPYGREMGVWIKKGLDSARRGATVVCVIPSRTDAMWWHEYVMRASEVRFLRGRETFGGSENPAPFPTAIIVFRPDDETARFVSWTFERARKSGTTAIGAAPTSDEAVCDGELSDTADMADIAEDIQTSLS